jgi:hypothetical protein
MLWELSATPEMFAEAFDKAKDTPGYDKITKIIQSIDNYQIFAKMMRKKNASLNEAAYRLFQQQDTETLKHAMDISVPTTTPGNTINPDVPTSNFINTDKNFSIPKHDETKDESSNDTNNADSMEQEQYQLIRSISLREEEERKKINEEEERMLAEVLALSNQEYEESLSKKQLDFDAKEKLLTEKEEKLKLEEKRIKKEEKKLEKKKLQALKEEQTKKPDEIDHPEFLSLKNTLPVAPVAPYIAPVFVERPKKKKKKIIAETPEEPLPEEAKLELTQKIDAPAQLVRKTHAPAKLVQKTEAPAQLVQKPATNLTYDLPPVSNEKKSAGMVAVDYDILRAASNDLFTKKKDHGYDPYADEPNFDSWNKKSDEEGKSMRELMKEKMDRMKPTVVLESDMKESVEERKARLQAHRDLLVKNKQEQMSKELQESREGKTENKYSNNLFKELMSLDKKVTAKEEKKKQAFYPKTDSPDIKPKEDDEAEVMESKKTKKDMKSLFDDSDDDEEEKKRVEEAARKERYVQVLKESMQESV